MAVGLSGKKRADTTALRIKSYLDVNFRTPFSAQDLCAQFFLSQRQLDRIFCRAYGMTVHAYLTELRRHYACALLEKGKFSARRAALDARAVNSRKVRVTARLSLCLRAYRETELALTDRIEGDGGAVFTRTETLRVQIPVSVEEKTFTVSETHRFLSGQPEADRLLCHTETVLLDDVSAAGSRVILQGRVCAAVTYLPQGQMCPVVETFETAFSQMLDCPADTSPCLLHTA